MRHLEDCIQTACVTYFNYQYPELRGILFAIPNGGNRNIREASRLKKAGVVAGVSDLILLKANKHYTALCEMKAGVNKQSEHQTNWQQLAERHGNKYIVCKSFDQFRKEITDYLSE